jgi:hypothetical protein
VLSVFALPIPLAIEQNRRMENNSDLQATTRGFWRWAITPPQSYAIYLVCLFLVAGLSFYVGTLRPKKPVGLGPPPITAPRN